MRRPVVDLAVRRALRRDAEALAADHPELNDPATRERCTEWLAGEEPDEHDTEPASSGERRRKRPASRGD